MAVLLLLVIIVNRLKGMGGKRAEEEREGGLKRIKKVYAACEIAEKIGTFSRKNN